MGRAAEEAEDFAFGLDIKPGFAGGEIDVRDAPVLARDFFRGVFRDPEEEFLEAGEVQPVIVPDPALPTKRLRLAANLPKAHLPFLAMTLAAPLGMFGIS